MVNNPSGKAGDVGAAADAGSILGWKAPWRRKWQSTPVFLPGKFHGQRSLRDCSPWGHKESDMTERQHACMCQEQVEDQINISFLLK